MPPLDTALRRSWCFSVSFGGKLKFTPGMCKRLMFWAWVGATAVCHGSWEGHNWNQWQQVTTWKKPELRTDQAGRSDMAPLLGDPGGAARRIDSVRGWEERRQEIAATIQQILGTPSNRERPPLEVVELGTENQEGYTRRHLKIRSESDDWIPAYLLVPKQPAATRVPAMLCLHQTVAQGKDEPCGIRGDPELAFAVELVRRSYVCLAPDVIGFGERIPAGQQPYHDSIAFYRKHPGWAFLGKMIWDIGRLVDYLETLPEVDPQRIGSIGHSHGAYGTLFAAAFEPRVSVAIASCGFTTFRADPNPERWSHATALLPQLGSYLPNTASIPFDWQHVLGLVAPRPLFIWYATRDAIFSKTDNLDGLLKDVQGVYRLYERPDALAWQAFSGSHQFPKTARQAAYRWLEAIWSPSPKPAPPADPSALASTTPVSPASAGASGRPRALKVGSAFFPEVLVSRARANAQTHPWAAEIRDSLIAAAEPWMKMSDDDLWGLMFGNSIRRSWQVWSNGHCPACRKPVPMYEWVADALALPWKMRCPRCRETFPKNDFLAFYRSGLTEQGVFDPARADRSRLFNTDHPAAADPLHSFGVDDGEGYAQDGNRWRFIGAYLIYGQWKQAIVGGIRNLAAAYVATGEPTYAHKAGVLLDRVADLYPTFDFGKEGVMYEGPPRAGYVSTWHDACVEVHDLALAYDAVFEGLVRDRSLVAFLAGKAAAYRVANPKSTFADVQLNIEDRIFRDTLGHRPKIESNYPSTDVTMTTLETVLDWPANRAEVLARLDSVVSKATAVDGVTGEKGIAGYATIAPRAIAELLGRYARVDPTFIRDALVHHPRLHAMFRFHLDTWCLGQYYPRTGDTGSFAEKTPNYSGLAFSRNPGITPSSYTFLWELYQGTGDKDLVRVLYGANAASTNGLPYDLFAADPGGFQTRVAQVIAEGGADPKLASVNKREWGLAVLRAGEGANARAAWLDYDSGERHGHADAMTMGLFAKGLDLLPDFGYPPVQYGGWSAPPAVWYTQTAAHNTVAVDGQNTRTGIGKTTLWFDGEQLHVVRAAGAQLIGGQQYERTIALIDISAQDSYLLDVFRVVGGKDHARFLHGHFGRLSTQGLSLMPAEEGTFGAVMRNFKRDRRPSEGWSADWSIEDRLQYLPPGSDVHLRHTDLTRNAEVETAEAWVAVGSLGGTEEAWIPSVLVRRCAVEPPLASTFVAVLEPYQRRPNLVGVRRFDLQDAEAKPCSEDQVGVEVRLANGCRDVVLASNASAPTAGGDSRSRSPVLIEKTSGVRFEGDFCLVRFDGAGPKRVIFCRGKSLRAGAVVVQSDNEDASFEIDLDKPEAPIVTGPGNAVGLIEIDGVRIWPR